MLGRVSQLGPGGLIGTYRYGVVVDSVGIATETGDGLGVLDINYKRSLGSLSGEGPACTPAASEHIAILGYIHILCLDSGEGRSIGHSTNDACRTVVDKLSLNSNHDIDYVVFIYAHTIGESGLQTQRQHVRAFEVLGEFLGHRYLDAGSCLGLTLAHSGWSNGECAQDIGRQSLTVGAVLGIVSSHQTVVGYQCTLHVASDANEVLELHLGRDTAIHSGWSLGNGILDNSVARDRAEVIGLAGLDYDVGNTLLLADDERTVGTGTLGAIKLQRNGNHIGRSVLCIIHAEQVYLGGVELDLDFIASGRCLLVGADS